VALPEGSLVVNSSQGGVSKDMDAGGEVEHALLCSRDSQTRRCRAATDRWRFLVLDRSVERVGAIVRLLGKARSDLEFLRPHDLLLDLPKRLAALQKTVRTAVRPCRSPLAWRGNGFVGHCRHHETAWNSFTRMSPYHGINTSHKFSA
jgi:hypothetical protein